MLLEKFEAFEKIVRETADEVIEEMEIIREGGEVNQSINLVIERMKELVGALEHPEVLLPEEEKVFIEREEVKEKTLRVGDKVLILKTPLFPDFKLVYLLNNEYDSVCRRKGCFVKWGPPSSSLIGKEVTVEAEAINTTSDGTVTLHLYIICHNEMCYIAEDGFIEKI